MKQLLTGYVVNFNRRHKRYGHLFQNRYKSIISDARSLGSGEFVQRLLVDAATREKETLRLARKVMDLPALGRLASSREGVPEAELRAGIRMREVVRARRLFCQIAVRGMGYGGAEVARFLGVTTSSVNRLAVSQELREVQKYLNALFVDAKNAVIATERLQRGTVDQSAI